MTREGIQALVDAELQFLRRHDSAGLAKAFAEDGIVESPIFGRICGRAAIEASWADLFKVFDDSVFNQEGLIVDGDRVVWLYSWQATHKREMFGLPPTNRRFTVHGASIYELKGDHIARERRIYDFTGLLVQIGVIKPRA